MKAFIEDRIQVGATGICISHSKRLLHIIILSTSTICSLLDFAQIENYLFFGCRYHDKDFYYKKEWDAYVREGQLTLFVACSRDQVGQIRQIFAFYNISGHLNIIVVFERIKKYMSRT